MSPCDTCTYKSKGSRQVIGGWLNANRHKFLDAEMPLEA